MSTQGSPPTAANLASQATRLTVTADFKKLSTGGLSALAPLCHISQTQMQCPN